MKFQKLMIPVLALVLSGCWALSARYIPGEDVAVRAGGGWTRASITAESGDTFTVKLADGTTTKVRRADLRPLLGADQAHVGQEVWAEPGPRAVWRAATITAMADAGARVRWADGSGEQVVPYKRLAPR